MSQYTTSTETVKSEDTTEDDSASISNDPRSSAAQSSVEDVLAILNAPSQTTSSNQAIEFEVYLAIIMQLNFGDFSVGFKNFFLSKSHKPLNF